MDVLSPATVLIPNSLTAGRKINVGHPFQSVKTQSRRVRSEYDETPEPFAHFDNNG